MQNWSVSHSLYKRLFSALSTYHAAHALLRTHKIWGPSALNNFHPGPKGTCFHTEQFHIKLKSGIAWYLCNAFAAIALQQKSNVHFTRDNQ